MGDIKTAASLGGAVGAGFLVGGPAGAAVGGALELAIPIIQGILQNNETERTNQLNLGIYNQERSDKLAAQRLDERHYQEQAKTARENNAFNRQQALYGNQVSKEQSDFNRKKAAYDNALNLLSINQGLNQAKTAPFIKRA